jgi:hypothetical protein
MDRRTGIMSEDTTAGPQPVFRIVRNGQGMGNFMAPPGHPDHFYEVRGYWPRDDRPVNIARRREADSYGSLSSVLDDDGSGYPAGVRDQARRIRDRAELVCSEMWVRQVYGYFRNSYSPDGSDENVSSAVSTGPAERHLGYLCVRSYFPDHTPRLDLIANPGKGYGSWPCTKCGKPVQYEAQHDALAEVLSVGRWAVSTECSAGGKHERES